MIASLLKQFFRDLPEPVLTSRLTPKFEQASSRLQLLLCSIYFLMQNEFRFIGTFGNDAVPTLKYIPLEFLEICFFLI